MNLTTRLSFAIASTLVLAPALAAAQEAPAPAAPAAPSAPQAPQAPQTPQTPQTPAAPNTTTTSSNQPVVVVNPGTPTASAPPVVMPASEPGQPSDQVVDLWNAPVFGTGAVVFGGSYLASVIVAGSSDHQGNNHLYVPVVGPWLDLADRGPNCPALQNNCDSETTAKVLLVADGVFQAAGVLTMLEGVLSPSRHARVMTTAKRDYHVTPTTVHGDPGLAVFGHF